MKTATKTTATATSTKKTTKMKVLPKTIETGGLALVEQPEPASFLNGVPSPGSRAAEVDAAELQARQEAKATKAATRATSGHAYALLAAYGEAQRTGGDVAAALAFCVDRFPAAIRKSAVKLAMTKEAPAGAIATALRNLHDSLPSVDRAAAVGGRGERVMMERRLKVLRPKIGAPYLPCVKLPPKLAAHPFLVVDISEDGTKITITAPKMTEAEIEASITA